MILVFTGESWIPEKSDNFDNDHQNERCKKYHNWKEKMEII